MWVRPAPTKRSVGRRPLIDCTVFPFTSGSAGFAKWRDPRIGEVLEHREREPVHRDCQAERLEGVVEVFVDQAGGVADRGGAECRERAEDGVDERCGRGDRREDEGAEEEEDPPDPEVARRVGGVLDEVADAVEVVDDLIPDLAQLRGQRVRHRCAAASPCRWRS